jgi:hypothetical protein
VDDAAAAAASVAGLGLVDLPPALAELPGSLKQLQLAQQQQLQQQAAAATAGSSSSTSPLPQVELLQQLASAASDVQQQLHGWSGGAVRAAFKGDGCPACPDERLRCLIEVVLRGCDGVCVLRDAQGQPMVRQHALLNVLHHLQHLQRLGVAMCATLPPPSLACANLACDNVSGLSDMQLVWRRGVCGHCRAARFCSAACLRALWAARRAPGSMMAAVVCDLVEERC